MRANQHDGSIIHWHCQEETFLSTQTLFLRVGAVKSDQSPSDGLEGKVCLGMEPLEERK